ncbi:MAG: universal stress protein [Actinobacteria bacterium]|nr:universal stress protein [Actinomycetota bacterium]
MAHRRQQDALSRVVGIGGLFGTAYGYVGTSIYFVLGGIALYSLGVTPFLILVVGLVFIVTAWSYAEGSAAMPEASGVASFARRAFDPMTGFIAAWALLLDSIILVAIACSFVPYYLGVIWPQLQEWPYAFLIGIGAVALLVALNVLGLQESVRLSSLMAVLGLATLLLLIVVGFFVLLKPGVVWGQIDLGSVPTWGRLLYAVPLAAAAFIGLDAISSRAESAMHPARDVPKAINVVMPLIVALSVGLGVVALSALPVDSNTVPVDATTGLTQPVPVVPGEEQGVFVLASDHTVTVVVPVEQRGTGQVIPAQKPAGEVFSDGGQPSTRLYGTLLGSAYLQNPVMGLVASLPDDLEWLKAVLRPWVAIVIAIALLLAANAVVGGSARIIYSLARHHQVPAVLGRVNASRMTPYVGIVLFGVAAVILLIPKDPMLLLGLFGFGAMVAFTLTHLSVIALRYREPALARPFVVPLNLRFRGALLPLPAVFGAVATALIWALMVATHPAGRIVGFAWMAAGLVLYVLHRRSVRQPLLRQPQETRLPSTALSDVDYDRILVPVDGTRLSDEMMVLGCQLAADKGATIDVVHVIEIPMQLPLDAPLADERRRGKMVLDAAMAVAREFGVDAWPHLVAARQSGRAIVDTAEEWNADVVIVGAVKKRRVDGRLFGDAVTYVLRHAPGEVLVNLVPGDYPMQGSAAEIEAELVATAPEKGSRADVERK